MKTIPTLREFAEDFMLTHVEVNNKPSEQAQKRWCLKNHLVPAFGNLLLSDIRPLHIAQYKALKQRTLCNKTINNHLTILAKLFACAAEWEVVDAVPRVKKLSVRETMITWLREDEARSIVSAAAEAYEPHLAIMIRLALNTGLRAGEIVALRWADVHLDARNIHVQLSDWHGIEGPPKNGKPRVVPINSTTAEMLRTLKHGPYPRVFWRVPRGVWVYRSMYYQLQQVLQGVGIECGWHTFRHTFASHLAQAGVPLYHIKELLGHSSVKMTERYAHLCPENSLEPAVETLIERFKF